MLPLRDVEGQLDALQGLVGVGGRDGADVAARRQLVVIGLVERRGHQELSRLVEEWPCPRRQGHDVRLSVGRTGSCHDNAVAESSED